MSESNSKGDSEENIEPLYRHVKNFGHIYGLILIFAFTVATRLQGYRSLKTDDGWILLGNDTWYHFRATMYTVKNFPQFLNTDIKTGFPSGVDAGAFGTVYDLIHASVSILVGLGDPSAQTVQAVLIFSAPIISGLAVVSVYFITKYVTGSKIVGLMSSLLLSLVPGTFYSRGIAGFTQHHMAEVTLLLVSTYFLIRLLDYTEENVIILEVVKEGNLSELKPWLKLITLSILSIFLYYLVWPPAIMFFGLVAGCGLVMAFFGYSGRTTVQPSLLAMSIITGSMVLMVLVRVPESGTSVASPSYLHLALTVVLFLSVLLSYVLVRLGGKRGWSFKKFSYIMIGLGTLFFVAILVVRPGIVDRMLSQIFRLFGYPLGLGGGERVQTIAEEQSTSVVNLTFTNYGLMMLLSLTSVSTVVYRMFRNRSNNKPYSSYLFLLIVFIFMFGISVGTVRFNYYLAPMICIFSGIGLNYIFGLIEVPKNITNVKTYHVLIAILILMLFIPVLLVPVASNQSQVYNSEVSPAQTSYTNWQEPLEWLSENSPGDDIKPYDLPNNYSNNSYGVMSWWDYGHWITTTSNRTPVANPFQQHAGVASDYLLSQSPGEAEEVMDELGRENNVQNASVKYIIIDGQMANPRGKFAAVAQFDPNFSYRDNFEVYYETPPGQRPTPQFIQKRQPYYESMIGRLYVGHGSSMEASSKTIEYTGRGGFRTIVPISKPIVERASVEEAKNITRQGSGVSRGGIGDEPPERVEALEQYRLVKSSNVPRLPPSLSGVNRSTDEFLSVGSLNSVPSSVKIFQKVPGAQIRSTDLESNTTYNLEVELQDTVARRPFTFNYTQRVNTDENGEFKTTVPYSSTGYDDAENPPETRAVSKYRLIKDGETVKEFDVPETDVTRKDSEDIEISLDED